MLRSCRGLAPVALVLLSSCADRPPAEPVESEATVEVLVRGSHFRGTNGIHFGPDGLLYVASVVTPALAAIDPESGEIKTQWGAAEGAKGPDDLAFGPDGSVYWTDITFGDVVRRAPDGATKVIASPGPGVNPITFSDDGRLFVSQCFLGDKLFEIDPDRSEAAARDQRSARARLRAQRHGLGPRRQALRTAMVPGQGGARRRRQRQGRDRGRRLRRAGRRQVRLQGTPPRARLAARRDRARRPHRRRSRSRRQGAAIDRGQPGFRRHGSPLRLELRRRLHRRGARLPSARARCSPAASARRAGSRWRAAAPARATCSTSPTSSRCAGSIP